MPRTKELSAGEAEKAQDRSLREYTLTFRITTPEAKVSYSSACPALFMKDAAAQLGLPTPLSSLMGRTCEAAVHCSDPSLKAQDCQPSAKCDARACQGCIEPEDRVCMHYS